jgi:hypothetical protein
MPLLTFAYLTYLTYLFLHTLGVGLGLGYFCIPFLVYFRPGLGLDFFAYLFLHTFRCWIWVGFFCIPDFFAYLIFCIPCFLDTLGVELGLGFFAYLILLHTLFCFLHSSFCITFFCIPLHTFAYLEQKQKTIILFFDLCVILTGVSIVFSQNHKLSNRGEPGGELLTPPLFLKKCRSGQVKIFGVKKYYHTTNIRESYYLKKIMVY